MLQQFFGHHAESRGIPERAAKRGKERMHRFSFASFASLRG
jgi:hypothetical protein